MPSSSLDAWRTDRLVRLGEFERQCAAVSTLIPPNPHLEDENLRGLIVLLSAHFQGFCRDLYTECAMVLAARIKNPWIRALFQEQFTANRRLDRGNPSLENIRIDFERFGATLDLKAADPANAARITDLGRINMFRNVAAHHGRVPPGGFPTLPVVQLWRASCDGLATSLDDIMYKELRARLGKRPWKP